MNTVDTVDTVPGTHIKMGDNKCWEHKGTYLGKYLRFELIGRIYDPDPEYTFEHGVVSGLGLKFREVPRKELEYILKASSSSSCE